MYAFRLDTDGARRELIELCAAQFRKRAAAGEALHPTDAAAARDWVARGGVHATPLHRDYDGRIVYARDADADHAIARMHKALKAALPPRLRPDRDETAALFYDGLDAAQAITKLSAEDRA